MTDFLNEPHKIHGYNFNFQDKNGLQNTIDGFCHGIYC